MKAALNFAYKHDLTNLQEILWEDAAHRVYIHGAGKLASEMPDVPSQALLKLVRKAR